MKSICHAVSAFIAGLLFGHTTSKKFVPEPISTPTKSPLSGYVAYHFQCWLCGGKTGFGLLPNADERQIKMDCSRCGVLNVVKVKGATEKQ